MDGIQPRMLTAREATAFDNSFAGRFFAVGSTATKNVMGKPMSMSQALDDLTHTESCGNGGVCIDLLEVDETGKYIKG